MARPIKITRKNMNVCQSFIMTTAHYKFSIDEKRIIYRLVEIAQSEIKGIKLKDNLCPLYRQSTLFDGMEITFPITAVLDVVTEDGSTSKHYDRIKNALDSLEEKKIYFEDKDGSSWTKERFIYRPKCHKGMASFIVSGWFWDLILDFSKGYTKYELFTAMRLKSPYSMRFYEIMSGNKIPYTLTIDQMRDMFGLGDKYSRPASIRERIIEPAKKELDAVAPYSFDVKEERNGDKKTSPIIAFTFIPRRNEDNQDKELQKIERQSKLTARNLIGSEIYETLRYTYGFKPEEISRNKKTIDEGKEVIPGFIEFLNDIQYNSRYDEVENKKGYVIMAIKTKSKEEKNGNNR